MKIRDLIEQLERFDPDGYICVECAHNDPDPTEIVDIAPENDLKHCAKLIVE